MSKKRETYKPKKKNVLKLQKYLKDGKDTKYSTHSKWI